MRPEESERGGSDCRTAAVLCIWQFKQWKAIPSVPFHGTNCLFEDMARELSEERHATRGCACVYVVVLIGRISKLVINEFPHDFFEPALWAVPFSEFILIKTTQTENNEIYGSFHCMCGCVGAYCYKSLSSDYLGNSAAKRCLVIFSNTDWFLNCSMNLKGDLYELFDYNFISAVLRCAKSFFAWHSCGKAGISSYEPMHNAWWKLAFF